MAYALDHTPEIGLTASVQTSAVRALTSRAGLSAEIVSGAVWDGLVAEFDDICQEQLFIYAQGRWPGLALEPIVFRQNRQVVGGALVMLQPLPLKLGTIALVKWGPILARADVRDSEALLCDMVDYLKAEYGERRAMMLSVMPMVEPDRENRGYARLMDMGFTEGEGLRAPDRYVVDIRQDDDARMAAFGQKWRYHLRKALKNELRFERAEPGDLDRFMVLYEAMTDRKRFADHSAIATVADLFALPHGKGRPELFFVTHNGETVSGAIIFTAGTTATYLYGATNNVALDLRAGYFLHWHIMRWLRDDTRAQWYDLGGTDGSQGLHQFKSGMVGEAGYINPLPPAANYAPRIRAKLAGEAAYAARGAYNRLRDTIDAGLREMTKRLSKSFGR